MGPFARNCQSQDLELRATDLDTAGNKGSSCAKGPSCPCMFQPPPFGHHLRASGPPNVGALISDNKEEIFLPLAFSLKVLVTSLTTSCEEGPGPDPQFPMSFFLE